MQKRRPIMQMICSVWKVLSGPNDDWPLALCDFESVDWEEDTTANDAIHPQRLGENWLLHHSEKHLWYYLSAMEEDDLIVLRNADSEGKRSCMSSCRGWLMLFADTCCRLLSCRFL